MEFHAFYILVASMILNFIVLGISLNRPDSFFPVSLSAASISLQGFALRMIVLDSIAWFYYCPITKNSGYFIEIIFFKESGQFIFFIHQIYHLGSGWKNPLCQFSFFKTNR